MNIGRPPGWMLWRMCQPPLVSMEGIMSLIRMIVMMNWKNWKKKRKEPAAKGNENENQQQQQKLLVQLPKRFKPRSLASILLEEVNRDDGVAYIWLDNEARINKKNKQAAHVTIMPPPRKYCPVTGMEGIYTEPKSRIPYANLQALEQIRERSPPWMTLGGNIAYHEAAKSIRDEEE
jgi:hypothetical protein